jgi:sortase A
VFREEDPLLKVGVIMMALALALTVVGVVVSVSLRDEPERAVASEKEEAATKSSVEPLVRSYPSVEQRVEEEAKEPYPVARPEAESASKPKVKPVREPQPEPQPKPESKPRPQPEALPEALPEAETNYWPKPTQEELKSASRPRYYGLPPGAIMGLTIEAIGIYDAPVFDSDSQWALANGVAHVPETSLPWSPTAQRNVFLAGHRMGYRGTWSRLIFYNLDKLKSGEEVVLKDRAGKVYSYRVSEIFLANPEDSWVMGQVRGRDMVTLQTCTPIPTFEKRLIVRADRV